MNPEFRYSEPKIFINGEPHSIKAKGKPRGCIFGNELYKFSLTENGVQIEKRNNTQIITRNSSFSPTKGVSIEIKSTL